MSGPLTILQRLGVRPTKAGILRELADRGSPLERRFLDRWGAPGVSRATPERDIIDYNVLRTPTPRISAFAREPLALRYEVGGDPLFDPGVYHYDVSGGSALPSIIRWKNDDMLGDAADLHEILSVLRRGQIRATTLNSAPEASFSLLRTDPFLENQYDIDDVMKTPNVFYPNMYEGNVGRGGELPGRITPRDLLNDADLRRAYNMSMAVGEDSPLQKKSVVFKALGGRVR